MKKEIKVALATLVVMVVLLIVICILLSSGVNGHYVSKAYKDIGIDLTLDVKGLSYTMKLHSSDKDINVNGSIDVSDNKVTLTTEKSSTVGRYDKKNRTITVEGIIFEKE